MSSPVNLYLSPNHGISRCLMWLCQTREIAFNQIMVNKKEDMAEINARNPNNKLPVLKHGELILTNLNTICDYILKIGRNSESWPGLNVSVDPVIGAKILDFFSYIDSDLNPAIKKYLVTRRNIDFDSLPDEEPAKKLKEIFEKIEMDKRATKFMVNNSFTIIDLLYFSAFYLLENDNIFNEFSETTLLGWYRVCRKIIGGEWTDEKDCNDDYEFDIESDDYIIAETIMDAVKENRPDLLEKLAKQGVNINMPLAVVEAVNRNNLFVLKVMRDFDCFLQWPMAIKQALRLSKPDDILALLIDPNLPSDKLKEEANKILKKEDDRMREVLGPEYEEYLRKMKAAKPDVEPVRNNTIMEGTHLTTKYVFFNGPKSPFSLEFRRAIKIDDTMYSSVLDYYLIEKAKFHNKPELETEILSQDDISEKYNVLSNIEESNDWTSLKMNDVLFKGNLTKFSQHKDLLHIIFQVGDRKLVKTGKDEKYWGIGLESMDLNSQKQDKWLGENKLGFILMKVKEVLVEKQDENIKKKMTEEAQEQVLNEKVERSVPNQEIIEENQN